MYVAMEHCHQYFQPNVVVLVESHNCILGVVGAVLIYAAAVAAAAVAVVVVVVVAAVAVAAVSAVAAVVVAEKGIHCSLLCCC
jgi:hypothetical protein